MCVIILVVPVLGEFKCFFCAYILGTLSISSVLLLSSNTLHAIVGVVLTMLHFLDSRLFSEFMIGIMLRRDSDTTMSSALIVDKLI